MVKIEGVILEPTDAMTGRRKQVLSRYARALVLGQTRATGKVKMTKKQRRKENEQARQAARLQRADNQGNGQE